MASGEVSFSQIKVPSEPRPIPSIGSDEEESFVVLGNSPSIDYDNFDSQLTQSEEPIGTEIIKEGQQILSEELNNIAKLSLEAEKLPVLENSMIPDTNSSIHSTSDIAIDEVQKKINEIVEENTRLKLTLHENNANMKKQHDRIIAWQEDVQKVHESHKEKFAEAKAFIEKLKLENATLKKKLESLNEQKANDHDNVLVENAQLKQELENLKIQNQGEITKLTIQLRENETLVKSSQLNINQLELDIANKKIQELENSVQKITYEKDKIEEFQRELTEKCAESDKLINKLREELRTSNILLDEMKAELFRQKTAAAEAQKTAVEEIGRLRSEMYISGQQSMLQNTEELKNMRQQLMNSQMAITSCEQQRVAQLDEKQREINELRCRLQQVATHNDDMFALKAQLDVYKTDFEAERSAKETLKAEKDRLVEDLQNIQRRNQQLQEEVELLRDQNYVVYPDLRGSTRRTTSSRPATTTTRTSTGGQQMFTCPKCGFAFNNYQALENHVYRCIELDESLP